MENTEAAMPVGLDSLMENHMDMERQAINANTGEVAYFRHRAGLYVKTGPESELEIDAYGDINLSSNTLGAEYYRFRGYKEITRDEFDGIYIKAVEALNKFAAL